MKLDNIPALIFAVFIASPALASNISASELWPDCPATIREIQVIDSSLCPTPNKIKTVVTDCWNYMWCQTPSAPESVTCFIDLMWLAPAARSFNDAFRYTEALARHSEKLSLCVTIKVGDNAEQIIEAIEQQYPWFSGRKRLHLLVPGTFCCGGRTYKRAAEEYVPTFDPSYTKGRLALDWPWYGTKENAANCINIDRYGYYGGTEAQIRSRFKTKRE